MKRTPLVVGGVLAIAAVGYFSLANANKGPSGIEYRYAPAEVGDLILSTSATGTLVPLTKVDVKSKAGGKVIELLVEEGTVVRRGDVIARIDPQDTQTSYEQAQADLTSAQARTNQAQLNAGIEANNSVTRVRDAEIALATARLRYQSAVDTSRAQPTLSSAELMSAEAGLRSAQETYRLFREVTAHQLRRDAEGQLNRAAVDLDAAQKELERQQRLLDKGYVSLSIVEKQRSALAASEATHANAELRAKTIDAEVNSQSNTLQARLRQAEEALRQSQANQSRVRITGRDLEASQQAVRSAEVALQKSKNDRANVAVRRTEVATANASAVRSQVAVRNALTQLNETTVIAPRDGVVTVKYLEEGTIIPPGTSTFAQGTSLVQIADVTRMFIECSVDETDIGNVRVGQGVKIIVEAFPGQEFRGVVRKVFPAAETAQSLTTVKVRVEVTQRPRGRKGEEVNVKPGMNATCEFILLEKKSVVLVPQQAVKRDGKDSYVMVRPKGAKTPIRRAIEVGSSGNDAVEILSGLEGGEEVVIAEVDLSAMRDREAKMAQTQQGAGFGSLNRGGPSQSRASGGGTAGGGSRGTGGGGGGR